MTSCNKVVERPPLKKSGPGFLRGPTLGTRYIRPRLQFSYCVTLIAAVNECPLQLSVAGWSLQCRRRRGDDATLGGCAVVKAHMK
jgi:hypothetical protein